MEMEKNEGVKGGGKNFFGDKKNWGKIFFEKKIGGKKIWGKMWGVSIIYDIIASSIFAPREPSSIISESFIVIRSAVFEKPATCRRFNVSVRIIITRSIFIHNSLGFSRRHQIFSFGGSPPLADESDEVLLPSYWILISYRTWSETFANVGCQFPIFRFVMGLSQN